jgi:hypothetical protein
MDVAYPLMVVGTAERHILIFNLSTLAFLPLVPYAELTSAVPSRSQPYYAS